MPSTIHTSVGSPWDDGSTIHGAGPSLPWGDGVTIHAGPSAYTPGPPAGGGTPTGPMPGVALYTIASRATYDVPHTMVVTDLRDDAVLAVESVSMSCDEDSILWTLRASGGDALYSKLTAGEQPAQVKVDIDGELWVFIIDSVSRTRTFGQSNVTVSGRSPAVAAGSPYEADQNWVNDGISTGAQIAAVANLYTGLAVAWEIEDWLVPDRVFSFSGTPLAVVARVAEAVGAVVQADRTAYSVRVMPRYPLLANEWPAVAPDVEIALAAVLSEQYERADRPEYTGIYLAGQQQGAVGFVRLAGTSGVNLHPLVTDLLLTEEPALRMRGEAILGASGGQASMTLTLPLLTGAGEPGVLTKGQLVRVIDPAGTWEGLVRSVAVNATLPVVTQTVVLERHTKMIEGTVGVAVDAPPEVLYVYDTFTEAGDVLLKDHVGEIGATWSVGGFWSPSDSQVRVAGGVAWADGYPEPLSHSGDILTPEAFFAEIRATFTGGDSGSSIYLGDSGVSGDLQVYLQGSGALAICAVSAGTIDIVDGVEFTLRVEFEGMERRVLLNGAEVGSEDDDHVAGSPLRFGVSGNNVEVTWLKVGPL